jgi:hypothetical protein
VAYPRLITCTEAPTLQQVRDVVTTPELLPLVHDVHLLELFFAAVNRAQRAPNAPTDSGMSLEFVRAELVKRMSSLGVTPKRSVADVLEIVLHHAATASA